MRVQHLEHLAPPAASFRPPPSPSMDNLKSTVQVVLLSGETVRIRVSGFQGAFGNFEMQMNVQCVN